MIMDWLRKYKNVILVTTVAVFVVSSFVGLGQYFVTGRTASDAVAEVNDEKIPYRRYLTLYNRMVNSRREQNQDLSAEALNQLKQEVIQNLIRESVFIQEAKRYGIEVTDGELAQSLAGVPAFQKDGKFSVEAYARALQFGLNTTPEEFEDIQRRQIAVNRLQVFVARGIKITDQELEYEFARRAPPPATPAKKGEVKDPAKEKADFREQLRQEKVSQVMSRWFQQLGTNVNIKVHIDEIELRGQ